jgi:hypothetical protein
VWIHSIRLDGVELELDDVLASLTIVHGRDSLTADPTASTCSLVLRDPPRSFTRAFQVGADLAIDIDANAGRPGTPAHVAPRFRGRVTDASLDDPDLTVTGAGRRAELRRAGSVSTEAWPAPQSWSQRVERFLTDAGVTDFAVIRDPLFDPLLERPPEAEISIGGYLAELAQTVGAAVYDDIDGTIVVHAIGRRLWDNLAPIPLDPFDVLYSPVWKQALDVTTSVSVLYGPDRQTSASVSDPASADRYGAARVEIPTTIADVDDARARAQLRLDRGAYPTWKLEPIHLLEADDRAPFELGRRVHLPNLPASAPFPSWTPVLEGWVDRIEGDTFAMNLIVSDPVASGFLARWIDAGATTRWLDLAAGLRWVDVTTPDQVGGAP